MKGEVRSKQAGRTCFEQRRRSTVFSAQPGIAMAGGVSLPHFHPEAFTIRVDVLLASKQRKLGASERGQGKQKQLSTVRFSRRSRAFRLIGTTLAYHGVQFDSAARMGGPKTRIRPIQRKGGRQFAAAFSHQLDAPDGAPQSWVRR
jgi:hypothetical protein